MDWTQILFLFLGNASLIIWFRAESRADYRSIRNLIDAIQLEIKDFHGRLCALEEKSKKDH